MTGFTGLFNSCPHFTNHYHTQINVYSHVFISRCSVAGSNCGCSPSCGFSNYPRASATSSWQQQLTRTESQQFSNSLTHSLVPRLAAISHTNLLVFWLTPLKLSLSLSWNKAPIWGLRPDIYFCLTVTFLFPWDALPDERTGSTRDTNALYSLGSDRTGNTVSNNSTVACLFVA
jgi:hypothetical protein